MDSRTSAKRPEKGGIDLSSDPLMDELQGIFHKHTPDRKAALMRALQEETGHVGKEGTKDIPGDSR